MGVIPTGAIYKTLTFDGKSSSEFNVYITGEAVFNAPEKAVEMVSIAGRNGAFALDYGRFENIEVTYNCGIVADDETDFAGAISDFRNWLCSRNGYVRLSDDYNTGEYRQAIYKSGLEVETARLIAGEFPIVFECKPQRFLTSGETAVAVTSGDDITNPTLFDARPLLEVTGYGDLMLGSDEIIVTGQYIGNIFVSNYYFNPNATSPQSITIQDQYANFSDILKVSCGLKETWEIDSGTISNTTSSVSGNATTFINSGSRRIDISFGYSAGQEITFNYGTASTDTTTASISFTSSAYGSLSGTVAYSIAYDGADTFTFLFTTTLPNHTSLIYPTLDVNQIVLNSTQNTIGNPIYIDLDIGEAYKIENGVPVSVNNAITIPAELPTLPAGNTTITYDNTITQFKVVPRWWKI